MCTFADYEVEEDPHLGLWHCHELQMNEVMTALAE